MSTTASPITGVPNVILNRSFRLKSKKTSKLRVTGLCKGNSPVTGEFPAQRVCNAKNVSIWWRHHVKFGYGTYSWLSGTALLRTQTTRLTFLSLYKRAHKGHGVPHHQQFGCLLNSLLRLATKKQTKVRITDTLCGEVPSQDRKGSMSWRHQMLFNPLYDWWHEHICLSWWGVPFSDTSILFTC